MFDYWTGLASLYLPKERNTKLQLSYLLLKKKHPNRKYVFAPKLPSICSMLDNVWSVWTSPFWISSFCDISKEKLFRNNIIIDWEEIKKI